MLSPDQLRAHYSGIGSSTAAAIVGLDPWCTPFRAYQLLTDPSARPDLSRNLQVKLGNLFEDGICTLAAERWDLQLMPVNRNLTMYHPRVPHFLAHPDRVAANQNAAVEAKFRGHNMRRVYEENSGEPLDQEYIQCQWQCLVGGFEAVYLAVVLGNAEARHWRIEANASDMDLLANECGEFWERYVATRSPPDPQTEDDVRARFPISRAGKTVEASNIVANAVLDSLALRAKIDALQAQDDELRDLICAGFGEGEALRYDGRVIATFKSQTRNDIDVKRLREQAPDIAKTYARTNTHRVLLLKSSLLVAEHG
jgi:predicted phage-related endonuclease